MLFASGEQAREDYCAPLFMKNNIDSKVFAARIRAPEWIYHYLKLRYKTGRSFRDADEKDYSFPEDILASLEKYMEETELAKAKSLGIGPEASPFPFPKKGKSSDCLFYLETSLFSTGGLH